MRVFVTGATGNIGSYVVKELLAEGHQVLGLSRSAEKAEALTEAGAQVHPGSLEDEASLRSGAEQADGVIHLAFNHDFSRYKENCEDDRRVIAALGEALQGTAKPLVVTSATPIANTVPGEPAREGNAAIGSDVHPRAASEEEAARVAETGVNVSVMRLPQVHDRHSQGLLSPAIEIFRARGACAYIGEGDTCFPAGHFTDVARVYRLAIERAEPSAKYHAVAEEGISSRAIAEALGKRLDLPVRSLSPEEGKAFFGWLEMFFAHDMRASSTLTRDLLGWTPTGPGLISDLAQLELAD